MKHIAHYYSYLFIWIRCLKIWSYFSIKSYFIKIPLIWPEEFCSSQHVQTILSWSTPPPMNGTERKKNPCYSMTHYPQVPHPQVPHPTNTHVHVILARMHKNFHSLWQQMHKSQARIFKRMFCPKLDVWSDHREIDGSHMLRNRCRQVAHTKYPCLSGCLGYTGHATIAEHFQDCIETM